MQVFFTCLIVAITQLFFVYLFVLIFLTGVFVLICTIDLIRNTRLRGKFSSVLLLMYIAAIIGTGFQYLFWSVTQ